MTPRPLSKLPLHRGKSTSMCCVCLRPIQIGEQHRYAHSDRRVHVGCVDGTAHSPQEVRDATERHYEGWAKRVAGGGR